MAIYGYSRSEIGEFYKECMAVEPSSVTGIIFSKYQVLRRLMFMTREAFLVKLDYIMLDPLIPLDFKRFLAKELLVCMRYDDCVMSHLSGLSKHYKLDPTQFSEDRRWCCMLPPTRYSMLIILAVFHAWCIGKWDTDLKVALSLRLFATNCEESAMWAVVFLKNSFSVSNQSRPDPVMYGGDTDFLAHVCQQLVNAPP